MSSILANPTFEPAISRSTWESFPNPQDLRQPYGNAPGYEALTAPARVEEPLARGFVSMFDCLPTSVRAAYESRASEAQSFNHGFLRGLLDMLDFQRDGYWRVVATPLPRRSVPTKGVATGAGEATTEDIGGLGQAPAGSMRAAKHHTALSFPQPLAELQPISSSTHMAPPSDRYRLTPRRQDRRAYSPCPARSRSGARVANRKRRRHSVTITADPIHHTGRNRHDPATSILSSTLAVRQSRFDDMLLLVQACDRQVRRPETQTLTGNDLVRPENQLAGWPDQPLDLSSEALLQLRDLFRAAGGDIMIVHHAQELVSRRKSTRGLGSADMEDAERECPALIALRDAAMADRSRNEGNDDDESGY